MQTDFTNEDLSAIRDAVPHLDLVAIRSLRRAGYDIVRAEHVPQGTAKLWNLIPRPMTTRVLVSDHAAE